MPSLVEIHKGLPSALRGMKPGMPSRTDTAARKHMLRRVNAHDRGRSAGGAIKTQKDQFRQWDAITAGRVEAVEAKRAVSKEFDSTSAALGAGGVASALAIGAPAPRSPMTNRGRGVYRKLERRSRVPGMNRTSLKVSDFAEVSGGRGYRPKNDQYTARMARSMAAGDKRAKQNRLVLDLYDNNVVQRDGAHRAEAAAMLGRKIKVKAVRHKGEKAPLHMTGINAIRDEFVQGRQRNRLKTYGRSGGLTSHELDARAGGAKKPNKVVEYLGGTMSRASGSGVPKLKYRGVSPAGVATGAGILGGTALLTSKGGRKKERS